MGRAAHKSLVVLVAVAAVGCSSLLPTAAPTLQPALRLHTTDVAAPLVRRLAVSYNQSGADVIFDTQISNHATLLRRILDGEINYFVTTELPILADLPIWAMPIAQVGIVIAVPISNPITNVTLADVRGLYLGSITRWDELGGLDEAVTLISREAGADIRTEFERLVMGNRRTNPNALLLSSSPAIVSTLRATPGSVAYLPLTEAAPGLRLLMVEGVPPTLEMIQTNRYPLRSTVYFVGLEEPTGLLRQFIEWAQSQAGQASLGGLAVPIIEPLN